MNLIRYTSVIIQHDGALFVEVRRCRL